MKEEQQLFLCVVVGIPHAVYGDPIRSPGDELLHNGRGIRPRLWKAVAQDVASAPFGVLAADLVLQARARVAVGQPGVGIVRHPHLLAEVYGDAQHVQRTHHLLRPGGMRAIIARRRPGKVLRHAAMVQGAGAKANRLRVHLVRAHLPIERKRLAHCAHRVQSVDERPAIRLKIERQLLVGPACASAGRRRQLWHELQIRDPAERVKLRVSDRGGNGADLQRRFRLEVHRAPGDLLVRLGSKGRPILAGDQRVTVLLATEAQPEMQRAGWDAQDDTIAALQAGPHHERRDLPPRLDSQRAALHAPAAPFGHLLLPRPPVASASRLERQCALVHRDAVFAQRLYAHDHPGRRGVHAIEKGVPVERVRRAVELDVAKLHRLVPLPEAARQQAIRPAIQIDGARAVGGAAIGRVGEARAIERAALRRKGNLHETFV